MDIIAIKTPDANDDTDGSVFSSCDIQFLYDILLQTIAERDEARQIAKEYRDSDGVESWYRDSTTDPLPWEAKDV